MSLEGMILSGEYIVIFIFAIILLSFVIFYNRLVALRQATRNAFADIDVQLRQRADLVPNLIETVKGYASHEKELLENVTKARSRTLEASSMGGRVAAENDLSNALMNLFAVAENYPNLKANENFNQLQSELSDIENKIAAARRFFNNAVTEYNTSIEQFPDVIIASVFSFEHVDLFNLGENRSTFESAPKVSF